MIYGACNVISNHKLRVLLHYYFSKYARIAVFSRFLMTCFPRMLLYVLNYFEMALFAPVISGITFVFTFHMPYISFESSLYFKIYSMFFLITSLSPEIAMSITLCLFLYYDYNIWFILRMVCQFPLVDFIMWLAPLHELFLIILYILVPVFLF
jgi:hypothetical protein